MTLGYTIDLPDNDQYMFENLELDPCAQYSNIYDLNKIDVNFKFKKRHNMSWTYEGFAIVSEIFKSFCDAEEYKGLEFVDLPSSPGFYWFKISNIIEYDTNARKTRFINYNENCKGYDEIIGATPVYLKNKGPLSDSFFRTDVCFGSSYSKHPLYLVGETLMKKLKEAGFKEIHFEKILDEYTKG